MFFYLLFQYNGITNTVRTTLLNIAHGNLFDFQLLEESVLLFPICVCIVCQSAKLCVVVFFWCVFFILFERQMIQQLVGTR